MRLCDTRLLDYKSTAPATTASGVHEMSSTGSEGGLEFRYDDADITLRSSEF